MGREERARARASRMVPVTYTEAQAAAAWAGIEEVLAGIDRQLAVAGAEVAAGSPARTAIEKAQAGMTWMRDIVGVMKAAAIKTAEGI